jgi:hypothetical protein
VTDPQLQPAASPPSAGSGPIGSVVPSSNTHLIAPVGLVFAGLLGLIGALLPWVSLTVSAPFSGVSQSIQGSSFFLGGPSPTETGTPIAVILGVLIVVTAGAYLFGRRNRILPFIAAALSLAILGFAVYKIIDVYRQANDFYNQMDQFNRTIPGPLPADFPNLKAVFHIDPAPGLWMVGFSGLLGIVLSLFVGWQARRQPPGAVQGQALPQPSPPTPTRYQPDVTPGTLAPIVGSEQPVQPESPASDATQDWGAAGSSGRF